MESLSVAPKVNSREKPDTFKRVPNLKLPIIKASVKTSAKNVAHVSLNKLPFKNG